jgi:hypothetical protein
MAWMKNKFFYFLFFLLLSSSAYFSYRWWKNKTAPTGNYHLIALAVEKKLQAECDRGANERRIALSKLMDRYRSRVLGLWKNRSSSAFPEFKMESVGPVFIRHSKKKKAKEDFESSVWSWEEANGMFLRTQQKADDPNVKQVWLDLDTAIRYLLEKDFARIIQKKSFLSPEKTEHTFRVIPAVSRVSLNKFLVKLNPGEFKGAEKQIERLILSEWKSHGFQVQIEWSDDPNAYRLGANFHSARSFVNHTTKEMKIANFAFAKTVAHEFGHVLGFDDHYYSVWNETNCYYTQQSRLGDLMSNSEMGSVQKKHWDILTDAYPYQMKPNREKFFYRFSMNSSKEAL